MSVIKVYGIDINKIENDIAINYTNDKEFIEIAEQQGFVWSLVGFQNSFNSDEINQNNLFIRFLEN